MGLQRHLNAQVQLYLANRQSSAQKALFETRFNFDILNMDAVVTQIQDLFEGQIVSPLPSPDQTSPNFTKPFSTLPNSPDLPRRPLNTGLRRAAACRRNLEYCSVNLVCKCILLICIASQQRPCQLMPVGKVIALIVGFVNQDIYLTMWIGLAGTLLAMLLVVPPWPVFNQHPQPWIGSLATLPPGGIVVGGGKGR